MTKHLLWALPSTFVLAVLETVVALCASFALSGPLAHGTGAGLDPARVVAGLVELSSTDRLGALARSSAIGLALVGAWLVLEPFLSVLFVRNHETHTRRGPMSLERRALRVVLARLVVLAAICVLAAIAYGVGVAVYVVLDPLRSPIPRDLVVAFVAIATVLASSYAYVVCELAVVRLSIRSDTLLESLLEGHRALDGRTLALRALLGASALGVGAIPSASPSSLGPATVLVSVTLLVRLLLRSAFIGWLVHRMPR